jgi:hypothetical protein
VLEDGLTVAGAACIDLDGDGRLDTLVEFGDDLFA